MNTWEPRGLRGDTHRKDGQRGRLWRDASMGKEVPRTASNPQKLEKKRGRILPWSLLKKHNPAAAAKSLQSCLTLCDPIDGSPPGSSVLCLQERTLEWVAISCSNAWKRKVKVKSPSRVQLFATPWTVAYQAPLSMGFSRQEYWSGLPCPSPTQPCWYLNFRLLPS